MADKDRTPDDLLGSLLSGKKPEGQQAGIPESQPTRMPAKRKKPAPAKKKEETSGEKIKATFYISTEAVEALEEGWIQLRRLAPKETRGQVSKSLIVELSLKMALEELESKGIKSLLAKKASTE